MMNEHETIVASNVAKNGMKIDAVIVPVGLENTKNCWRAEAKVDGTPMAFSHHGDRAAAEKWAKGMQETYLEVHGGKR